MVGNVANWGTGVKVGDVTTDFATDDKIGLTAHGLTNNDSVHFTSTGTLPAGLNINTQYFVINATANDFEVSLTKGGAAVNITDDGTGTHSVYDVFVLPDLRGRLPLGKDDMGGTPANRVTDTQADNLGQASGAETVAGDGTIGGTAITTAQLASHNHTVSIGTAVAGSVRADETGGGQTAIPTTSSTGSGTTHNHTYTGIATSVKQPYQTVNYIIKT